MPNTNAKGNAVQIIVNMVSSNSEKVSSFRYR